MSHQHVLPTSTNTMHPTAITFYHALNNHGDAPRDTEVFGVDLADVVRNPNPYIMEATDLGICVELNPIPYTHADEREKRAHDKNLGSNYWYLGMVIQKLAMRAATWNSIAMRSDPWNSVAIWIGTDADEYHVPTGKIMSMVLRYRRILDTMYDAGCFDTGCSPGDLSLMWLAQYEKLTVC
jgi:hypothetical protein